MPQPDFFLSIAQPEHAEFKDRGSRFLSFAYPVTGEKEVKQYLEHLRQRFPDATHHCYACILGADKYIQRSSDDGEPSNTAGKPILRQILSKNLSNVLVVVVRYFGGIQLGVPGLINAYGEATKTALSLSEVIEQPIEKQVSVAYHYEDEGLAFRLIKQLDGQIFSVKKESKGYVEFRIRISKTDELELLTKQYYQLEIRYLLE